MGLSPAFNEICPGWILKNNVYATLRNQKKYRDRNKARRQRVDTEIFRPDIIDKMRSALRRLTDLRASKGTSNKDRAGGFFLDSDVKGIGKNYMTPAGLAGGIDAYTFFIRYFALRGLAARLQLVITAGGKFGEGWLALSASSGLTQAIDKATGTAAGGVAANEADASWQYECGVLEEFFPSDHLHTLLSEYKTMVSTLADWARDSKSKDDKRGLVIIPDYDLVHDKPMDDKVIKLAYQDAANVADFVDGLLGAPVASKL